MSHADFPARMPLIAYPTNNEPPDLSPAPIVREWMNHTGDSFAKRCLPMLIANQYGWLVLNNFSFVVTWTGGDGTDAVHVEYGRGTALPMACSHFGYGIVTFCIPYLFRTPPGWDLHVRGPVNYPKDGVYALEGIVETDWASAPFTMNWKITRPGAVHFGLREPICMVNPQPRGVIEAFEPAIAPLMSDPATDRRYEEWGRSREAFLCQGGYAQGNGSDWQRHYMKGHHATGEPGESHKTRLRVAGFARPADD